MFMHSYLNSNQITSVPPGAFTNLPALQFLYVDRDHGLRHRVLSSNQITSISPGGFTNLPSLQDLYEG